jgi:hypothetical protein
LRLHLPFFIAPFWPDFPLRECKERTLGALRQHRREFCTYSILGELERALDLLVALLPRANHETKAWILPIPILIRCTIIPDGRRCWN